LEVGVVDDMGVVVELLSFVRLFTNDFSDGCFHEDFVISFFSDERLSESPSRFLVLERFEALVQDVQVWALVGVVARVLASLAEVGEGEIGNVLLHCPHYGSLGRWRHGKFLWSCIKDGSAVSDLQSVVGAIHVHREASLDGSTHSGFVGDLGTKLI